MPSQLTVPCWVLHDGAPGNRRQALALAEGLGLAAQEWRLDARGWAKWLAPRRFPGSGSSFGRDYLAALRGPAPALAIGCGRIAALATRQARESGVRTIQILDPRISTRHWDLVIAPEHDGLVGDNVIAMLGSLNPVTPEWLQRARQDFPEVGTLASPRTAVLLGGPTRATRFDRSALEVLLGKLEFWLARDGGSLLCCASRRTPPEWADLLRDRYRGQEHLVWMDPSDGRNPFPAVLAWADRIVVSPDSVNMISEACATAVPVYVAEPDRASGRTRGFIESLQARDRVRAQTRDSTSFAVTPVNETQRVVALVRERLRLP